MADPGSKKGGGARVGRPKGSKSPLLATKVLLARVKSSIEARPGRDLEAVLSEIHADAGLPLAVRLQALRWLADSMLGRLGQLDPAKDAGLLPRRPGKPKGYRGAAAITRALVAQVEALAAADRGRELGAILSDIASSPATATDVRLAAVRRLAGVMMGQIAVTIEAEGRRLR